MKVFLDLEVVRGRGVLSFFAWERRRWGWGLGEEKGGRRCAGVGEGSGKGEDQVF